MRGLSGIYRRWAVDMQEVAKFVQELEPSFPNFSLSLDPLPEVIESTVALRIVFDSNKPNIASFWLRLTPEKVGQLNTDSVAFDQFVDTLKRKHSVE